MKLNSVSEKKRSVEAAQKSSETKPLNDKTKEEEKKVSEKKSEFDVENEIPDEQDGGQFQLNGLMTGVLEDELQAIMIEVWQSLPDDPTTEAERFVAEIIRNEASDELKNVLGLNVTKRLLNVYNPLFVKICFSCRPESGCLTKFLDAYNVKEFKRICKETNTFAARLTTITDFDNICSAKDIRCGSAKITVSSYYKFSQCPEKLNTIYLYKDEGIGKTKTDINEIEHEKETNTPKEKEKPITESNISEEKRTNISKEKEQQNKMAVSETKEITKTQKKKIPEKVTTQSDTSAKKPKTKELKALKSSTTKLNTSEKKHKIKELKALKSPTIKTNTSEKKPKIQESKQNTNIKNPIAKPAHKRTSKEGSRNKILSKPKKSTELKQNIITNDDGIIDSEINNEFDEFGEEMNDEEILALISGGVIVDECIGSDEE